MAKKPKKTTEPTNTELMNEDPELEQTDTGTPKAPMVNDAPGPRPKAKVTKSNLPSDAPAGPRRWWIWVIAGAAVVLAGLGWFIWGKATANNSNTSTAKTNTNTVTLVRRQLDGVLVAPDKANTNILAVMIENAWESRPPSGIDKACVVYEALAEGGITRFMALFPVGVEVKEIGPVRSARPYYVSWAEEYNPLYVHVGGSPQALDYLRSKKPNLYDFNQFYHAGNFWRDRTRAAPHNLYTSSDMLYVGLKSANRDAKPVYTSWNFKDEAGIDTRGEPANDIVINFSSFNYQVTYKYDRGLNQYNRYLAGKEHVTRDGSKITAKNVIVEYVKTGLVPGDKERLTMETVGSGNMLLFRDGQTIQGTWKKDGPTARTQFLDAQGSPVQFDAGTTWIEVIPTDRKVTY